MKITVYGISGAPRSWRVQIALALKGLSHEVRFVEGSKREHETPEFRIINPHGKVPVIEIDGVRHRESLAILAVLDREFPDRPLFGTTAAEIASVWEITSLFSDYLLTATNGVVFPIFGGDGSAPEAGTSEAEALGNAVNLLNVEHRLLEDALGDCPFLCGDRATAAEAVAYPDIGRIMRAMETKPEAMAALGYDRFDQRYPRLAAWRDRVAALPGIQESVPPHWRARAS